MWASNKLIIEREPVHSVHGDFLYIFSLLDTVFVRRQLMDLLPPPPPFKRYQQAI